jgi:hypothetical protein
MPMQIRPGETYSDYVIRLQRRVSDLERQLSLTPDAAWQSVICAELNALRAELAELGELNEVGR